jgi:hypothetical protein
MNYFNIRDTVLGLGIGATYGYTLNKSGLLNYNVIRNQFKLKDWTLFKVHSTLQIVLTARHLALQLQSEPLALQPLML